MTEIISFQGHKGAYSDMAARAVFPNGETYPCQTFDDAFNAIKSGETTHAVLPIENSIAGRVANVHQVLPKSGLQIIGEYFLPVHHCLMALPDADESELTDLFSHAHALPQCRKISDKLNLTPRTFEDTAGAARYISEKGNKGYAAIASELAAEIYGLKILYRNVEDQSGNTTRFLVLSPSSDIPSREDDQEYISSYLFKVSNDPGSLYHSLGAFESYDVNLFKLDSYVTMDNFNSAQFYCEISGHCSDDNVKSAIDKLGKTTTQIKWLGSYPQAERRSR